MNNPGVLEILKLEDLPDELLIHILRNLDVSAVKEARLTCRRWSYAGAHSLFRRIYFAPRRDIMSIFNSIVQNSAFAANITEVVYDARMFWSYMKQGPIYARAFRRKFSFACPEDDFSSDDASSDDEGDFPNFAYHSWKLVQGDRDQRLQFRRSQDRYASLLQEQTSIIETNQDFEVLCNAFTQLPNLKRISVLDMFDGCHPDFFPFAWDRFQWYCNWSAKCFKGIALPSRWMEALFTDRGKGLLSHPWEFRGLKNLLEAARTNAPKLKELFLGCQKSNLSVEIYSRGHPSEDFSALVSRLTTLKVDCVIPNGLLDLGYEDTLLKVLHEAQQLEELYVKLYVHERNNPWFPIFQKQIWPHLRVLDLGDGLIDFSSLRAITSAHAHILRELRLRNIRLPGPESWEEVATEIGQQLKLQCVMFSCLSIAGNPFDTAECARLVMSWISGGDLSMITLSGSTLAWHRREHVLRPDVEQYFVEGGDADSGSH